VRKTPKQVWLFVLTLIGVTGLALVIPDLILGGMRSIQARYLMPCYLGIPLAVAYLLATQMPLRYKPGNNNLAACLTCNNYG